MLLCDADAALSSFEELVVPLHVLLSRMEILGASYYYLLQTKQTNLGWVHARTRYEMAGNHGVRVNLNGTIF